MFRNLPRYRLRSQLPNLPSIRCIGALIRVLLPHWMHLLRDLALRNFRRLLGTANGKATRDSNSKASSGMTNFYRTADRTNEHVFNTKNNGIGKPLYWLRRRVDPPHYLSL